jgi:nucleoside phosphorylase
MTELDANYGCSFAIMTVVPEAHRYFRTAVGEPKPVERDGYYWTVAQVDARDGGSHLVVEAQAPQRSNLVAQEFGTRMLGCWRPRYFLIADIGGGIHGDRETPRDGLKLGDVVVAELLHYYELVKLEPSEKTATTLFQRIKQAIRHPGHSTVTAGSDRRKPRYVRWQPISPRLSTVGRELDTAVDDWRDRMTTPRPGLDGVTQLLLGEVVVGDKLLANPGAQEVEHILKTYDKALAVDMESVGAAVSSLSAADDGLALSYGVLRGISDWMDRPGNQETRDAWKPYAADAAIAAALGVVAAIPSTVTGTTQAESDSISELRRRLAEEYDVPEETYPSAVLGPTGVLSRNDVLAIAARQHGVVLVGDAGLGKTAMVAQAARAATAPLEPFPVLIDLKRWKPEFAAGLAPDPNGDALVPSMDALLRASVQRIGARLLDEVAARRDVLVLVDGVNEVPYSEVPRILTLLQEYMRARPRVHVLVTDRRAGDVYREQGWTELRLQRLEEPDVERIVDSHLGAGTYGDLQESAASLLRIPYFLDRAVRGGDVAARSRAGAMESFLRDHVGLTPVEMDELAAVAYSVYDTRGRRTFPAGLIDEVLADRLRESGVMVDVADGDVRFDHQLEHDYLASRHLAADVRRWTTPAFDAVTFETASFDVIALGLEQVAPQQRDSYLRQVYNWNWIGAIMALADVEQDGFEACTRELRTALLAVVAEKRFDRVAETRERTERQIARFSDPYARGLATAKRLGELIDVVEDVPAGGPEWFEEWRAVFRRCPPAPLEERDVSLLARGSAVIGWTAANVVRRFPEEEERADQVRALYAVHQESTEASRAVRWRAVHALGAWPSAANATLLFDAIDHDAYSWVKYGAVRSVIENAARTIDQTLRDSILARLRDRVGQIPPEPLSQLAWSTMYDGADTSFANAVRPILHAALEAQRTATDQERWQVRIDRFEAYWNPQPTS